MQGLLKNNGYTNRTASPTTTAAEIMTHNPVSISEDTSIRKAAVFLTMRVYAAPVIDAAGRPVGVVSRADIVRHVRDNRQADGHPAVVRDIMSPDIVFARPATALSTVIDDLLEQKIRRLFIVDDDGVLVGVLSVFDVLRHLQSPGVTKAAGKFKV